MTPTMSRLSTIMTVTMLKILGRSTCRTVAHLIADLEKSLAGVLKVARKNLSVSELQKLKSKVEAGLEDKFMLMAPLSDMNATTEQLQSIYSITMRVEESHKSLQAFDMDDVFTIKSE